MESLVVIGVMTIVLVMVAEIFTVSYDIFIKQTARTENDTGAVLAARSISEAARGATGVISSATINGTLYTTSDTVLVVETPSLDSSYAVIAGEVDRVAIFRDATETAKIFSDTATGAGSVRPSGKKLVTANNTTLVFRYDDADPTDADRVSVYLVNAQTKRGQTFRTEAWTSIFMRNR